MSGLVGQIRANAAAEKIDLSGYTESRVRELVVEAFQNPIDATEMIKFTFIVGGGKLVRSKYDDNLPKWMIAALREIGFSDDRSAAETFDSQGTFKSQHDTGANLKYVIVYPRINLTESKSANEQGGSEQAVSHNVMTPEQVLKDSILSTFTEIVKAKTHSWRQRKALLTFLETSQGEFNAIEQKLIQAQPLSPQEQALYDNSGEQLEEKITWTKELLKTMIDEGRLSESEKVQLLKSIDENIESSKGAGDEKKVANLTKRREHISKITPLRYRLYNHAEIIKLRVQALELGKLEDKLRSMSLSIAELKKLEEKATLEANVAGLEAAGRGWFLSDEDFEEMCKCERDEAQRVFTVRSRQQSAGSKSAPSKSASAAKGGGGSGGVKFAKASQPRPAGKTAAKAGFSVFSGDSDED